MQIKISVFSANRTIQILSDDEKNIFKRNGIETQKNPKIFNMQIKTIIKNWPNKLVDENVLDGTRYEVKITDGKTTIKKVGVNYLPNNFEMFMRVVGGNND